MRPNLTALAVLATLAAPLRAEVRLLPSPVEPGSRVRVSATNAGPWTTYELRDAGVLNPDGDVEGDGAPSVAQSESGWLVAWSSPLHGEIRLARATDRWLPRLAIAAPDAVGTPLIVPVRGGWIVATRTAAGRVAMAGCSNASGTASGLEDVGEGRLLGGRRAGDDALLILGRSDGCLEIVRVQMLVPDPQPIEIYRQVECPGGDHDGPIRAPRDPRRAPSPERPRYPGGDDDGGGCDAPYPGGGPSSDDDRPGTHAAHREPVLVGIRDVALEDGAVGGSITWSPAPGRILVTDIDARGDVVRTTGAR